MGKTSERLEAYQTQMSIYAEQHKIILASDVLDMIEQLQDDLKDDVEKVVSELENKSLKCKMEAAKVFCEEDYRTNTLKQYVKQSNDMQAFAYDKAIEIVKAGGIDG